MNYNFTVYYFLLIVLLKITHAMQKSGCFISFLIIFAEFWIVFIQHNGDENSFCYSGFLNNKSCGNLIKIR